MKKMYRITAFVTAALLLIGTMSACSSSSPKTQSETTSGPVKLSIAWFGSQARNDVTIAALKAYTAANPNVTFDPTFVGSNPEFSQKLATQAAGKKIPDIIIMDLAWLKDYASKGQLLELTGVDTSKIEPSVLDTGKYDGKLYALATGTASTALVYNKAKLDQLGGIQNMPVDGWTWDNFDAFNKEVKAKIGSDYVSADLSSDYTSYVAYQESQGKGSPITVDGKINFDKQTWLDYEKMYSDYRKAGIVPTPDISTTNKDGDVTQDVLLSGKTLMKNAFSSTFSAYDAVKASTYALVTYPKGTMAGDYVKASAFWSVAANTKYPDEAKKVVDWLVNSKDSGKILGFTRGIAANSDVLTALTPSFGSTDRTSADLVKFITPTARPFTMTAEGWNNFYMTDYVNICQALMFGKQTPDQTYDAIIAKANEYVK
jgi:ABC-type sugar transport system, periplasmic component